jgi:NHLM bacteriocin system ABC transporter ATP-binding protein
MTENQDNSISPAALLQIATVLDGNAAFKTERAQYQGDLWHAFDILANALNIQAKKPSKPWQDLSIDEQLILFSQNNKLRHRQIALEGDAWHHADSGPLLLFYDVDGDKYPAILQPKSSGTPLLIVPGLNIKQRLAQKHRQHLSHVAYMFYRTLPDGKLNWRHLMHFSLQGLYKDFRRIILLQVTLALLALLLPIATGLIIDNAIPNADVSLLWQVMFALIINAVVITLFNIGLVLSTIRIRLKINAHLQAAIWDRIIRLPTNFFRRFTAGDLADRASGIDESQQQLTSAVFITLVSGIMSLVTLLLLFYIDAWVGLLSLGLIGIVIAVGIGANFVELIYQRRYQHYRGQLTGFVLQLLTGISKLKTTNSISRAFEKWAEIFSQKSLMQYQAGKVSVFLNVFTVVFSVIITLLLFATVLSRGDAVSFGEFIILNVAFAQFFAAMFGLIMVFGDVLLLIPNYERMRPILETIPEQSITGSDPGVLTGKININHLSFRYHYDAPYVFKDLNLSISPGEFVAIVGPSGCGKSTLFRLLLGFEMPQTGFVLYDDRELSSINLTRLREQCGVVLQDTRLFSGSILENIIGTATNISLDDVHDIIQVVGLWDEINAMPMQMHTLITDTGETLSTGQRQRILLARALIRKPKILFLDEASSALDNITQAHCQQHLEQLNVTRVVAAHRITTIKNADRIIVFNDGKIAEVGNYQDLMAQKGLLYQLAQRQLS